MPIISSSAKPQNEKALLPALIFIVGDSISHTSILWVYMESPTQNLYKKFSFNSQITDTGKDFQS